jgi:hypothetical protein
LVAIEFITIDHFVCILIDLVLVIIVEAEVVKEVHEQLLWISLVPLRNAGKQHNYEGIRLKSSVLGFVELVMVG